MEIFGIGPMELILILIVALMVFGPDKLPQIGAKLGHAMRDMRKATRAISDEINNTRAAVENPARELAEPFHEVADAAKAVGGVAAAARNPGAALRESVLKELNTPLQPDTKSAEAATPEENTIAPPQLTAGGETGQPQALAPAEQPTEPVAALPAPDEPVAQLPAPIEPESASDEPGSTALPLAQTSATEEEAEDRPAPRQTPDGETPESGAAALPSTNTPPEQ